VISSDSRKERMHVDEAVNYRPELFWQNGARTVSLSALMGSNSVTALSRSGQTRDGSFLFQSFE